MIPGVTIEPVMPTAPGAKQIADKILELLPPDGSPVLNRAMRVTLQRTLAKTVSADIYSAALDLLTRNGDIGRVRGQGGQIFAVGKSAQPERPEELVEDARSEAELMPFLRAYLEGPFRKGLDLPENSFFLVEDTSAIGPRLGRWARPDYVVVTAMRFDLLPGAQVDLHSFELKTECGATDLAVYEALAQTRFTHFGHLVWQLPERSGAGARLPDIQKQCDQHGIGLIVMRVPEQAESCEIILDPVRKQTLPREVDGFLSSRLSEVGRKNLRSFLQGAR